MTALLYCYRYNTCVSQNVSFSSCSAFFFRHLEDMLSSLPSWTSSFITDLTGFHSWNDCGSFHELLNPLPLYQLLVTFNMKEIHGKVHTEVKYRVTFGRNYVDKVKIWEIWQWVYWKLMYLYGYLNHKGELNLRKRWCGYWWHIKAMEVWGKELLDT